MSLQTNLWVIKAITNIHAGSGDSDYGIVDKHVQRDPVTNLPTINASSIKGAFRENLEDRLANDISVAIFGSKNDGKQNDNLKQGNYRFYSAKLLALPIRSDENFYYVATCPELLSDLLADKANFGFGINEHLEAALKKLKSIEVKEGEPIHYGGKKTTIMLEDFTSKLQNGDSGLEAILGPRIALLHSSDFSRLSDELPIIARNHLENGISANLWYEQVVPREARFYCPITQTDKQLETIFQSVCASTLQIGGNATVGYGLCKFTKI